MTDQQERALLRANDVRVLRAARKVGMKRGREDVRELLLDPPPFMEGMRVEEFVRAVPKVGTIKTGRILKQARVRPTERLGRISLVTRCHLYTLLPR